MASEEELIRARRAKFEKLEQAGTKAFPNTFRADEQKRKAALAIANDEGARSALPGEADLKGDEPSYCLFGRVVAKRGPFVVLRTPYGDIQALVRKDRLPEAQALQLAALDLGDFAGVNGPLIRTGKGDVALRADDYAHVGKAILPPPDKWHGLSDVEKRYRERYVDLFTSPDVTKVFRARSQVIRSLRAFLDARDFLEVETPLLHPLRGGATGSKKRYAGLSVDAEGREEMVYRGLEMARSDWTPLARQFQEGLLSRIFHEEPYRAFVADYARSMLNGQMDALLVYRKRLRHRLDAYEVNVPPQVRAARIADAHNAKLNRPLQYQRGGWIEYVMTQSGPEPMEARHSRIDYEHYLVKQLQPIADAILQPLGDSFAALTSEQKVLF